jgi:hypothetical protein
MSEPSEMELVVGVDGVARCIYDEALDLREFGKLQITRASRVEPDAEGYWWADMAPVDGPVLGPYRSRSEALGAERGSLSERQASSRITLDEPQSHYHQHRTDQGKENGPKQASHEANHDEPDECHGCLL